MSESITQTFTNNHYIYDGPYRVVVYRLMTRDEIEPMVPRMPTDERPTDIRSDGGKPSRYTIEDAEAPLVPDLRTP